MLPTMSGNKKTSLWEKLSKGDMTWEMMYQGAQTGCMWEGHEVWSSDAPEKRNIVGRR